jgi:hypothetical protein
MLQIIPLNRLSVNLQSPTIQLEYVRGKLLINNNISIDIMFWFQETI